MTSSEFPQSVTGRLFKLAKLPAHFFMHLTDKQPQGLNHNDPLSWEQGSAERLITHTAGAPSSRLIHISPAALSSWTPGGCSITLILSVTVWV